MHLPRPAEGAAPPLDDDQQRVVAHVGGPLLVLAGPGTGKTTTIVEAAAARLCGPRAMRPDEVAVLTFSRRAAAEVRSRLAARLPAGAVPVVSTFHSFAWRLLAEQSGEFAPQALLTGPNRNSPCASCWARPTLSGHDGGRRIGRSRCAVRASPRR